MKIKNNLDKIVTILLIIIIAIFGFINRNRIKEFDNTANLKATEEVETPSESLLETKLEDKEPVQTNIYVDISGCITNPGVYEMNNESRINDLVEKAGGLCKEADIESINLSQKLVDEMKIHVHKIGENASEIVGTGSNNSNQTNDKVNINKADISELTTLPGIGKTRAEEIISYRNTNKFKSIEDIKNISGIGEKTFEKLKDKISIN